MTPHQASKVIAQARQVACGKFGGPCKTRGSVSGLAKEAEFP